MKSSDFPELVTNRYRVQKTAVYGYEGDDEIYGHDLGNALDGSEGNDILKGGDKHDHLWGGTGNDFLYGEGDYDVVNGGDDNDYILSGDGDDIVVTDDTDTVVFPGSGDDYVYINSAGGGSQKSVNHDLAYEEDSVEFSHLFITDSSGVDTLDFSQFNEGIVLDLDLFDTLQIYTESADTLALYGTFEGFIGTEYDDVIHIDPDPDVARYVDGGSSTGGDTLYVDAMGEETSDDGHTITIQGYQLISYESIANCVIINASTVGFDAYLDSPDENRLLQNYPNPFNSTTIIRFTVKETTTIELNIYDIQGRLVNNIADGEYTKGSYEITFSGEELSSGIYYCHLQGKGFTDIMKMVLLK